MKKDIPHDLIERYLNGDLPDAERQELERRLATDAGFSAEVELQRAIQKHLGNPVEMRLRGALEDMWKDMGSGQMEPEPKREPGLKMWRNYLLAVAAALALILVAWWWFRPSPEIPEQPIVEKPALPAPAQEPRDQTPAAPQAGPIAMANPADFMPNPALETRIGGIRGDNNLEIELSSPAPGAKFRLRNNRITLQIDGSLQTNPAPENKWLHAFIYSNRPADWTNKKALLDQALTLVPQGPSGYSLHAKQTLRCNPGLYYLVIGQQRTGDAGGGFRTIWVGKFTVIAE